MPQEKQTHVVLSDNAEHVFLTRYKLLQNLEEQNFYLELVRKVRVDCGVVFCFVVTGMRGITHTHTHTHSHSHT